MSSFKSLLILSWIAVLSALAFGACLASDVSGNITFDGKSQARNAVVYLIGDEHARPETGAKVDQRDKAFIPHVSVVPIGTRVSFPNDDTVFHNVFAYFNAKKFDLGMYPRGASKEVTFDKEGVVALLCNVHPDMSAYIMVVNTPYYAVTDSHGTFAIKGVRPGHYVLHVWHESGRETTQSVDVGSDGQTLSLVLPHK